MKDHLEILIAAANNGTVEDVSRLATFAWNGSWEPVELETIAEKIIETNRDRHRRLTLLAARLFRKAGNLRKDREIVAHLADGGYAPAIHLLGAIYYQEGDEDRAIDLFGEAKRLGYKIGASAYYKAKQRQSFWPMSIFFGILSRVYLLSSKTEKERRGAPDHASLWHRPD